MANQPTTSTYLVPYPDPSPPTALLDTYSGTPPDQIPDCEYPIEICINDDGTIESKVTQKTVLEAVFEYVDDLRQDILYQLSQAEQGTIPLEKKEYRRLQSNSKAIDTLLEQKECVTNLIISEITKTEQDNFGTVSTAFAVMFSKLYELFEKAQFPFVPMFNCYGTSQLPALAMTKPKKDVAANLKVYELGDAKAIIEKIDEVSGNLRPSTCKLFYAFLRKLTEQNSIKNKKRLLNPKVVITYEEYAQLRGMELTENNLNNLRAEVKQDREVLMHLVLKWGKDGKMLNVSSYSDKIKGGVEFVFNPLIAPYATQFMIQFPLRLLELDSRNQSAFALGKKLSDHYFMDENQLNGKHNIIGVQTMLKTCLDIPSYEQIKKENRNVTDRIIKPLEQKLNVLRDVCGYSWQFCNSLKKPLTDKQKELLANGDYLTFQGLYITFEIAGAPDQTERLEKKAEERKALAEKKAEKEKAANSKKKASRCRPKRKNISNSDTS